MDSTESAPEVSCLLLRTSAPRIGTQLLTRFQPVFSVFTWVFAFSSTSLPLHPLLSTQGGIRLVQKLRPLLMRIQRYQRFSLNSWEGQNMILHISVCCQNFLDFCLLASLSLFFFFFTCDLINYFVQIRTTLNTLSDDQILCLVSLALPCVALVDCQVKSCCTELVHAFLLHYFHGSITHTSGRFPHTIVQAIFLL